MALLPLLILPLASLENYCVSDPNLVELRQGVAPLKSPPNCRVPNYSPTADQ